MGYLYFLFVVFGWFVFFEGSLFILIGKIYIVC